MSDSPEQRSDSGLDLEFPDWSGMKDSSQMIDLKTAFLNACQCYKWVRDNEEFNRQRTARMVDVEFKL